ncbi:MAG: Uma2 family endonuclease, partial [Deltaproteobacteria bacterium]|nr:Uma2 family endonuclease [Deltaproteobacteria bacterium]
RTKRPAAYQDVLDAPEHMVAEIIDGELVLSPRPAPPHAYAASILGIDIGGPFGRPGGGGGGERPGGWLIIDEPELHLGRYVVVPDLAGWRRERMPALPRQAYFELPPDWACEVISPSSLRRDRIAKMHIYAQAEVSHVWLVEPLAQTLEVFALQQGMWVRTLAAAGEERVRADPFAAVELLLADWWAPLEEEPQPEPQAGAPQPGEEAGG